MYFATHNCSVVHASTGVGTEDLQAGLEITTRLEEMRKEGGDKWLSIFNATQHKVKNKPLS